MKIVFIILIIYMLFEIIYFKEDSLIVKSQKINSNLKIIQISDFHDSKLINFKRLKKSIDKFNPDIIVLTGDLINRYTKKYENIEKLLKSIEGYKVFFVEGNHEIDNPYKTIYKVLEENNIINLSKSSVSLNIKSQKINLYGNSFGKHNVVNRKLNLEEYNILLSHNPNDFLKKQEGFDLVLSGHTHGGQVRIPYFGQIVDHGMKFFPKYSKGLYDVSNTKLYIDSGLGQSLPIRIFNRVSYTNITISAK